MTLDSATPPRVERANAALSLYHLLDPAVLANPYPLFHRLRREDPIHWDSYLHAWVVTRYADVLEVLHSFSADRTPTPAQLSEMGLSQLKPIAQVMIRQMLFLDAPAHTRLRGLASKAFTPARVEALRSHIRDIVNSLLDKVQAQGRMDVIADLADPLPAIVTAELLGVPVSDHRRLKAWSANFAEMLGNFQHNPDRAQLMLRTVEEMTSYFQEAIREIKAHPREGLIHSLLTAEVDGDRLTEEEVIANTIVTMVGGQETTTNLIGNGVLTLLRNPGEMKRLCDEPSLIPSAIEEMLRYESPSQHTARLAPSDRELGGKQIRKRQAVIAVMAAANRDPERFADPDRFDITRPDNRHLAFGYAAHFCFGAPLARTEGQMVFEAVLRRLKNLRLEPQSLTWRTNLGLRGLISLHVAFGEEAGSGDPETGRHQHRLSPAIDGAASEPAIRREEKDNRSARGFGRAGESLVLSRKLVEALTGLGRHEDASLFLVMLAAFKALLSRYRGQEVIVVGSVPSGRQQEESEPTRPLCAVSLLTDLSGDPTFRQLLARVKREADVSSREAVRNFSLDRPDGALFQFLFLMQDASLPALEVSAMPPSVPGGEMSPELTCAVLPGEEGLTVSFNYRTSVSEASTIVRMRDSFQVILEAIVENPGEQLSRLPLLGSAERERILTEWNATAAAYSRDKCVHELIEAQAERTPDAVAVQQEQHQLTYRELNERANQLAHYLRRLKVGPDVAVGICLESSPTLAVALLAVLKAGGACLPLDPAYPGDRLKWMVEDAQISVLLSDEQLLAGFPVSGIKTVCVESSWEFIAKESSGNPENVITPDHLAYVIYTSGSTGRPKGVMLPHAGLVNYITAAKKLYRLQPSDRQLQFSSISFDIAIEEIFPIWAAGATLVLRSKDFSIAGSDFLKWIEDRLLSVLSVPTAYWHELVHELSETSASLPQSLRLLVVGGEKAQVPVLDAWRKFAGDRVRWINTYGPTETSVIATAYELPMGAPLPNPLPIGRPIDNVRIYLLDEKSQPVPIGVPGEIHIGGAGLARGYLNRSEETVAKFVADPFSAESQARLYKTGDLARYLPNGELEFVGRRDSQIKIRGFRVEPGEIEIVLASHPSVREAVVVAQDTNLSGNRLLACLVPAAGQKLSVGELRNWLKERLPDYMIPADFVFLSELPLTPNGKVDRRALADLPVNSIPAENSAPASDAVEAQLMHMWEEVIGRTPIGIRENFFELGGHSLIAVRLMRRIEQGFGRRLPLATLLEAPTIEQLAVILRQDRWNPQFPLIVPIQPQGSRPPFFCVHGLGGAVLRFQELARHMAPDQPFYGIQPQGMDGGAPVLGSVEEMAACYIAEMRKFQPEGPYYIGGYSFGGLVAFEMARQLRDTGQEVGFLGLLDTYPGQAKSKTALLSTLLKLSFAQQIAYVRQRVKRYGKGIRRRWDALFLPKPLKQVRSILARAELSYQPRTYLGPGTWFRAGERGLRGLDNSDANWSRWIAGGVEIHEFEGDHGSILKEPMVSMLARKLRRCLEKAQQEQSERQLVG
jgi:amino acid adenylation domain-containing protein